MKAKFLREKFEYIQPHNYGSTDHDGFRDPLHGTGVASKIFGVKLGLAKRSTVVLIVGASGDTEDPYNIIHARVLTDLLQVLHQIRDSDENDRGKYIVNLSYGWNAGSVQPPSQNEMLCKFDVLPSTAICLNSWHS